MAIDYAVLKTECQTNPNGYSDAASGLTLSQAFAAGADALCADILNRVRNTITIARSNVAPQEVIEAIRITDFVANATTIQASWFESFTQLLSVQLVNVDAAGVVTDKRVITNLLGLLTNGSASENRLRALATRKGSRAEQLFGEGTQLTSADVLQARSA